LEVTPRIEAESVNSCRIVRVTQEGAGLKEICPDAEASFGSDLALFNAAVTISVMRELQVTGTTVDVVPGLSREEIPAVRARIAIGGKLRGFSGFAPGVFEEALLMLERNAPVYLLGGFGGATGELADRFLGASHVPSLTVERLVKETPALGRLNDLCAKKQVPPRVRTTEAVVSQLSGLVKKATQTEASLVSTLNTGLSYDDTRALMTTNDIDTAVRLVLQGLRNLNTLSPAT
jgi:hypothetical protein